MRQMMIQVEGLTRRFGKVRALRGLNLNVKKGAIYGFLGPNGAGKTTTMRILSGLARADHGQAWIDQHPIPLQALGQRPIMGVLPEEPAFYTWMTPREYLRDFLAPLFKLGKSEAEKRTQEILAQVGLSQVADRRIGGFSRGMRQRLGLAQALINSPPILLLDEPISALDPAGRREVMELIETLRGSTTIVLSTHILADVERICDSIGIIDKGKLILEADRQDLVNQYARPIIELEVEDSFGAWPEEISGEPFVERVHIDGNLARIGIKDLGAARSALLASIARSNLQVRRFEISTPSLEDIFLKLTNQKSDQEGQQGE